MNVKKRIFKSTISILLVLSMVISPLANIQIKASETILKNNEVSKLSSRDFSTTKTNSATSSAIDIDDSSYIGKGFEIEFNVTSKWNGAFNGSISIKNTSDKVIENWTLMFDMKNEISNIWNASIENYDNGRYLIKNVTWNQDIPVGGCVDFGFTAIGDEIYSPNHYSISTLDQQANNNSFIIDFIVNSDWGVGVFCSN